MGMNYLFQNVIEKIIWATVYLCVYTYVIELLKSVRISRMLDIIITVIALECLLLLLHWLFPSKLHKLRE